MESDQVTAVTIFNRTYKLRGRENPEYVRQLASFVDERMVELSNTTPTVDTVKLVMLAALSIADQYLTLKKESDRQQEEIGNRIQRMQDGMKPFLGVESG